MCIRDRSPSRSGFFTTSWGMCGVRSQVGSVGLCGPDQPLDGAGECEMSFGGRLSVVIGLFVVAAGFAVWAVVGFMLPQPATVDFTSAQPAGAPVDLTVQTVGSIGTGFGNHPTWVSYLVKK